MRWNAHILFMLTASLCLAACGEAADSSPQVEVLPYCARVVTHDTVGGRVYAEIDAHGDRLVAIGARDLAWFTIITKQHDAQGRLIESTNHTGEEGVIIRSDVDAHAHMSSGLEVVTTSTSTTYKDGEVSSAGPGSRAVTVFRDSAHAQLVSSHEYDGDGAPRQRILNEWEDGNTQPTRSVIWYKGSMSDDVFTRTFDARGCVITEEGPGQITTSFEVDRACRPLRQVVTRPDATMLDETRWTYDPRGRVMTKTHTVSAPESGTLVETHEHDWTLRPRVGLIRHVMTRHNDLGALFEEVDGRYDVATRTFTSRMTLRQEYTTSLVETFNAQDLPVRTCQSNLSGEVSCSYTEYLATCARDRGDIERALDALSQEWPRPDE